MWKYIYLFTKNILRKPICHSQSQHQSNTNSSTICLPASDHHFRRLLSHLTSSTTRQTCFGHVFHVYMYISWRSTNNKNKTKLDTHTHTHLKHEYFSQIRFATCSRKASFKCKTSFVRCCSF